MSEESCLSINLIALGNTEVGKTAYLIRNTENKFRPSLSTVGIDMRIKKIELENGKKVNVRFYDTSGQERYHSLSANFIKRADGIILMYDITNRDSFDTISRWWDNILEHKERDFPVVLVGNKCDLEDERKVTKEEGEDIAKKYNVKFYEASNKDGTNVEESFRMLIKLALSKMTDDINLIKTKKKTHLKLSKLKFSKRMCLFSMIKC
jgi:small GTP-binding protein